MCRHVEATLPATPSAPRQAREWVAGQLRAWGLGSCVDDVALIVSELTTNAVLYARTPAHLLLSVAHGVIEVGVADGDTGAPRQRTAETSDVGGRGLHLVEHLSTDWGERRLAEGKVVWSRMPCPDGSRLALGCVCDTADGRTAEQASGSGRTVVAMDGDEGAGEAG